MGLSMPHDLLAVHDNVSHLTICNGDVVCRAENPAQCGVFKTCTWTHIYADMSPPWVSMMGRAVREPVVIEFGSALEKVGVEVEEWEGCVGRDRLGMWDATGWACGT